MACRKSKKKVIEPEQTEKKPSEADVQQLVPQRPKPTYTKAKIGQAPEEVQISNETMALATAIQAAQVEALHRVASEDVQMEAIAPAESQSEINTAAGPQQDMPQPAETVHTEPAVIDSTDLPKEREEFLSKPVELQIRHREQPTVVHARETGVMLSSEEMPVVEDQGSNMAIGLMESTRVLRDPEEISFAVPPIEEQDTTEELLAAVFENAEGGAAEYLPSSANNETELFAASMHAPETQTRQVSAVCAELPETIQNRLTECVWENDSEQKVAVETLVLAISLAADRLHDLAEMGAMEGEEATQITVLLRQWHEELSMLLEADVSEQDVRQFITRICSESFGSGTSDTMLQTIRDDDTHEIKTDAFSIPQTFSTISQGLQYLLGRFAIQHLQS